MFRKTLTILSLISLLLSVGLWLLSYAGFILCAGDLQLELYSGALAILCWGNDIDPDWWIEGPLYEEYRIRSTFWLPELDTTGFLNRVPLWIPTFGFAAASVFLYIPLHRRHKRKKLGLCVKCGYDLRGSKDRCPECGAGI